MVKIKVLDEVLEQDGFNLERKYDVLRTEMHKDDLYYVVLNDNGEEYPVIDMLAKVVKN